jgi:maltoporin
MNSICRHREGRVSGKPAAGCFVALIVLAASGLSALAQAPAKSEVETLRQELRQVRGDYERRIEQLEQRLRDLEAAQATAVQREENLAATVATNRAAIDTQFQSLTEVRERALVADPDSPFMGRLEQVLNDFIDFGGYFRAGYGLNDQGRVMSAFQAPGALTKYRLGNEAEQYGELILGKSWYLPDTFKPAGGAGDEASGGPMARFQMRLSFHQPYDSGETTVGLPEAWASVGRVFASQPGVNFWAGNRFYRRHDIHLLDFFFLNMSSVGGGFEDLDLGVGKLALAFLGATSGDFGYPTVGGSPPVNEDGFAKRNLDLRWYDLPVFGGNLEAAAVYSFTEGARDPLTQEYIEGLGGGALSLVHTHENFPLAGSVNKFSVQAGMQAAKTFTSGFDTFNHLGETVILPDFEDSWRFRVTENFIVQPAAWFSVQPVLVYQYTEYLRDAWEQHWGSAGLRPVFHLGRYVSLAFEGGVDYVDEVAPGSEASRDYLYKFTFGPQVSLGRTYLSRPSLRAFVTYAGWGDDFRGRVGGPAYADANEGVSYGVQMETWW